MRTTIDVPEALIDKVRKLSGTRKKKDAVRIALEEFVRRREVEKLLSLPGKIEVMDITAEMEELEVAESNRGIN